VNDAAVVAREDAPGGTRLVAYVAAPATSGLTPGTLRPPLERQLPEYMVPSAFVVMAALPVTPNGKLDRKALPGPEAPVAATYAPPVTPPQKIMCDIAADLLRVPRVGIHDNFFDLGGHSLLATQFVSRVRNELHLTLSVRRLFENPTVGQLSDAFFGPTSEEGEI